ncbi:aspartate/glutamate/uridylate kinase [Tanacetum coccineum]
MIGKVHKRSKLCIVPIQTVLFCGDGDGDSDEHCDGESSEFVSYTFEEVHQKTKALRASTINVFVGDDLSSSNVAMLIAREVSLTRHNDVVVAIIVGGRNMFYGDTWEEATNLDRRTPKKDQFRLWKSSDSFTIDDQVAASLTWCRCQSDELKFRL